MGTIADKIGAQVVVGQEYTIDCSADVGDLTFILGGKEFSLSKEDLIIAQQASTCVLGLMPINTPSPMWILGDVFMRKYYVQFDWEQKRLGFAPSVAASATIVV